MAWNLRYMQLPITTCITRSRMPIPQRVAVGGIVQPTPLRLQYLDLVLSNYRQRYDGVEMPVDIWTIHAFILNEQNCDPPCPQENCWGADIPPGISACTGETFTIQQNDDLTIFKGFIERFRQWMADNGYQDRPLLVTEFGVLMWPEYGFDPPRVNAFMNGTFDYLSAATGPFGYAADKRRLVQGWAWYSLTDTDYNGWLFDPSTRARTVIGDNFAGYTAKIKPYVNLMPLEVWVESSPTSLTLVASVSNNGNVELPTTGVVRFYDGDPENGGVQVRFRPSAASVGRVCRYRRGANALDKRRARHYQDLGSCGSGERCDGKR